MLVENFLSLGEETWHLIMLVLALEYVLLSLGLPTSQSIYLLKYFLLLRAKIFYLVLMIWDILFRGELWS